MIVIDKQVACLLCISHTLNRSNYKQMHCTQQPFISWYWYSFSKLAVVVELQRAADVDRTEEWCLIGVIGNWCMMYCQLCKSHSIWMFLIFTYLEMNKFFWSSPDRRSLARYSSNSSTLWIQPRWSRSESCTSSSSWSVLFCDFRQSVQSVNAHIVFFCFLFSEFVPLVFLCFPVTLSVILRPFYMH